jgi:hypothetical protein
VIRRAKQREIHAVSNEGGRGTKLHERCEMAAHRVAHEHHLARAAEDGRQRVELHLIE